jgi:aspartyl-tRNA(Asn)/glutamyl-tRNA(Gln) amidotransferase subunit A
MPAWFALGVPGDAHFIDTMTDEQRELLEHGFLAFAKLGHDISGVQMAAAAQARHHLNMRINAYLDDYSLLLTPTCADVPFIAEGPPPNSIGGRSVGPAGFIPFTYPFNLTGHPAASLPAGLARGLPVGLQVVGPRYGDALVLAVSAAFEAARPWAWPG